MKLKGKFPKVETKDREMHKQKQKRRGMKGPTYK